MTDKKYNHAFSIAFSIDSNLSTEEWLSRMGTPQGLNELAGHLIKRAQQVIKHEEYEAYDLWDSYEH